jgi:hypothetical protein
VPRNHSHQEQHWQYHGCDPMVSHEIAFDCMQFCDVVCHSVVMLYRHCIDAARNKNKKCLSPRPAPPQTTDMKCRAKMLTDMSPAWCKNVSARVSTGHTQMLAFSTFRHHFGKCQQKNYFEYYFLDSISTQQTNITIRRCCWGMAAVRQHFGGCVMRQLKVAVAAFGDGGGAKCDRT